MQSLRVDTDDLRLTAGRVQAIADNLATVSAPPTGGSSWLASSAAVSHVRADAQAARATLAARMQATSEKCAAAGVAYASSDAHLAANLRDSAGLEAG